MQITIDARTVAFIFAYTFWAISILWWFALTLVIEGEISKQNKEVQLPDEIFSSHIDPKLFLNCLFALTWPFSALPALGWILKPFQTTVLVYVERPEVWLLGISASVLCTFLVFTKAKLSMVRSQLVQSVWGAAKSESPKTVPILGKNGEQVAIFDGEHILSLLNEDLAQVRDSAIVRASDGTEVGRFERGRFLDPNGKVVGFLVGAVSAQDSPPGNTIAGGASAEFVSQNIPEEGWSGLKWSEFV